MQQGEDLDPGRIKRLLVVDDQVQNRYMLEVLLQAAGYAVTPAKNGAEALEYLQKERYDAVVSDILMPVMDGFQLIRECKKDLSLRDIPFIFYTATYTEQKDRDFGLSLGALRYIIKPAEPDELVRQIEEAFREHETSPRDYTLMPVLDEEAYVRGYTRRVGAKLEKKARLLDESERKYQELFRTMAQGVVYQDRDGRITDSNPAAERILGLTLDQMQGRTSMDPRWMAMHEDGTPYPGDTHPSMVALLTAKETRGTMGVNNPSDGKQHWILIHAIPQFREGETQPWHVFTTFEDITERKVAEEALQESEERYRSLFENMLEGFAYCRMISDTDGRPVDFIYLRVNRAFRQITGTEAVNGKRVTEVFPAILEAYPALIETYGRVSRTGTPESFEIDFRPIARWLHVSVFSPVRGYFGAVFEDITARKGAEERVALANRKLALMNDVTYQDIQNKVTALRGYVALSREEAGEEDLRTFSEKEQEILLDIHRLIEKTKDYQQLGLDKSRWILLEPAIRSEATPFLGKRKLVLDIRLDGLALYTDPLIDRVFYNLISNAFIHGQTVTRISFRYEETPEGLMLTCEDDGIGIPLGEKEHIYNRIVGGKGRFGLFFVREFLEISGMSIRETGEPGKGARFEITVPKGIFRFEGRAGGVP